MLKGIVYSVSFTQRETGELSAGASDAVHESHRPAFKAAKTAVDVTSRATDNSAMVLIARQTGQSSPAQS